MLKQSVDTQDCSFLCKHSLDVDIHVIKHPCIARGLEARFLYSEAAQFVRQKLRDDLLKPIASTRFEVSYQQFKSQVPQPVRKRENLAAKESSVKQI